MNSGIYTITNTQTGRYYIGRTGDWKSRQKQHKCDLRGNRHDNSRLQHSWNKRGESAFTFEMIWSEANENLVELEGFILEELFDSGRLYNMHKNSDGGLMGMKVSEETKAKLRVSRENSPAVKAHIERITSPEHHAAAVKAAATPESRKKAVATRKANGHLPFSEASRQKKKDDARARVFAALDWAVLNSEPRYVALDRFKCSWGSLALYLPEWEAINGKLPLPIRASGDRNGKRKLKLLKLKGLS